MATGKDLAFRALTTVHRGVLRLTGFRVGARGMGMPVVILTTTGRKSGQRRETVLTTPLVDGESVVLVASFGGDDRNPAWYLNLREHPEVELEMEGRTRPMTAHVATPDEKADLWPRIIAGHDNYAGYQTKTDRDIPVVVLEPREA